VKRSVNREFFKLSGAFNMDWKVGELLEGSLTHIWFLEVADARPVELPGKVVILKSSSSSCGYVNLSLRLFAWSSRSDGCKPAAV
jgi:hypothetical protein